MNRLIVAFSSEAAAHRICAWLTASGLTARTVCRTGAQVLQAVRYMGGGCIVCAARLPDYTADELYADLDGQADMLVIGKPEQLDACESPGIRRLPLPVSREAFAEAIDSLLQSQQVHSPAQPSAREQALIAQAKKLLQSMRGMTEPEAHRYLQQRSMQARRKMADTAKIVIAALDHKT